MKYRIIILIIIIIRPGQILLSYIANTSRTHTHTRGTHTRTHRHTPSRRSGYRCSMGRWLLPVTARSAGDNDRRCFIQINTRERGRPVRRELVRGCTASRYEQFETSPEMIEQELQFANSDSFKENYLLVFVNAHMHVRAHVHIPVWNTRRSLT